ncbi:DUF6456 domain-containing protein [Roseivivax sediminis]|nr:DUF6456 domain-containing protein [Roseivivax sediminis]
MKTTDGDSALPDWVPDDARRYLEHTESGRSLRALAKASGCHASTVMRQVRRIEIRREDPLVDAALKRLGAEVAGVAGHRGDTLAAAKEVDVSSQRTAPEPIDGETLKREAARVLRLMGRPGTLLAVAQDMDKAVVVKDDDGGGGAAARQLVIDAAIAQAMALKGWIACDNPGRVSRYRITAAGRGVYQRMVAEADRVAHAGFAEAQAGFDMPPDPRRRPPQVRTLQIESPVAALARRRDKAGVPFLDRAALDAAERLREDYEIARLGEGGEPDIDAMMRGEAAAASSATDRPAEARRRLAAALRELGPGLGDMAMRCCCRLEGLETAEQNLGWSARSGKIVLRIALQRLARHYERLGRSGRGLIG